MEVHFTPEIENSLHDLASRAGRTPDDLVQDALAGYLNDLVLVQGTLDGRFDEIKSGLVTPIDGNVFFESLRLREIELMAESSLLA